MKKSIYITIIFLFLIGCISQKKRYSKNIEDILFLYHWTLTLPFEDSYLKCGELPPTIQDLEVVFQNHEMNTVVINQINKYGLYYIPIYNKKTKLRSEFIVISSGIDGKIDFKYNQNDTLYKEDIDVNKSFYNSEFTLDNSYKELDFYSYIDFWNTNFGNKDFIILYQNCMEYQIKVSQENKVIFSSDSLFKRIESKKYILSVLGLELEKEKNYIKDSLSVIFEKDSIQIIFKLNPKYNFDINNIKDLLLIGYTDSIPMIQLRNNKLIYESSIIIDKTPLAPD